MTRNTLFAAVLAAGLTNSGAAQDGLLASKEGYDYAAAMKAVAKKFNGTSGVVVLMGDSITYANPNTAWALYGAGRTQAVKDFLKWSHAGAGGDKDGWTAAKTDVQNGRSHTAASGCTTAEYLSGGKNGLPSLAEILKKYNPQMAVYMLGTNDISQGVKPAAAAANAEKAIDAMLANGTIPVLSTVPPYKGKNPAAEAYNAELKKLAAKKKIPLLDLFGEMKARNPELDSWLQDGVHPTVGNAGAEPTPDNLKKSGYLLRCYVNVLKLMEVRAKVLDGK